MDKIGVSAPATDPQAAPSDPQTAPKRTLQTQADPKLVDLLTRRLVDLLTR